MGTLRQLLVIVLSLALLFALTGCRDRTCRQAYERVKTCMDQLGCDKLAPSEKTRCQEEKALFDDIPRDSWIAGCTHASSDSTKYADCQFLAHSCSCE